MHAIWTPGGAIQAHLPLTGPGYFRFAPGCPDIHLLMQGGSAGLVLSNGAVDKADRAKQLGTLTGRFQVVLNGALVIDAECSLPDGTAMAWSQPGPAFTLKPSVVDWILRDGPGKDAAVADWFWKTNPYYKSTPGYDEPEPDQAGSPRLTEYASILSLGPAYLTKMGLAVPPNYRLAAFDWTRLQYRRPYIYYDQTTGEPWRFSMEADSWADEKGWRKSGNTVIDRPSLCTYQAADPEHLAIDREWADAVLWNDPLAWKLLDQIGEAICSWPMCRDPFPHGNLRAYGRTIKALTLIVGAFAGKRPQFGAALFTAYSGLVKTFGVTDPESEWPIPFANPSPSKGTNDAYTHVGCTSYDIASHPEMTEDALQEALRAVMAPWIGTALTALQTVTAIPAALPSCPAIDTALAALRACLLGPARDVEGIDNDGKPAYPAPFHDSYAWQMPHRVKRANIAWGGTMTWTAPAVAALAKAGDPSGMAIAQAMKANMTDFSSLSHKSVEDGWSLLGIK